MKNKILSFTINLLWIVLIGGTCCLPLFLVGHLLSMIFGYGLIRAALVLIFGSLYIWKGFKYLDIINSLFVHKMCQYEFYASSLFGKEDETPKTRIAEPSIFDDMTSRREVVEADLRDFDNRLRMRE